MLACPDAEKRLQPSCLRHIATRHRGRPEDCARQDRKRRCQAWPQGREKARYQAFQETAHSYRCEGGEGALEKKRAGHKDRLSTLMPHATSRKRVCSCSYPSQGRLRTGNRSCCDTTRQNRRFSGCWQQLSTNARVLLYPHISRRP